MQETTGGTDQTTWLALGVAVLAMAWVTFRAGRRRKDPLERPPSFASLSQQRAVEREMQSLLVELEQMVRTMNAQLDTRAAKIEQLIADADARIAELRRLQNSSESSVEPADYPPLRITPSEPNIETADVDPRHAEIYSLADGGMTSTEIARKLDRPNGEIELILALRRK
mgnify:CR=1 FL=1